MSIKLRQKNFYRINETFQKKDQLLMSIQLRQNKFNKIQNLFRIKDNFCSTYMDSKILKKLDEYDMEDLGEGAKGKIYKLIESKNNIALAVKVMLVDYKSTKYIMDLKSPRWREVKLLLDFTKDVKGNLIRNLPLTYGYQICKIKNYNSIIIYYEYFDDILKNWLKEKHTENEWISFILQCLITIKFLREKYLLTHNDLTWVNIMFNKVNKGDYWKYITNKYQLYIPNTGYEFIFWDFGSSKSYKLPLRNFEKENLDFAFKGKRDQKYILDLTKRIKIHHIINRYSLDELRKMFNNGKDLEYLNNTIKEETERFKRYKDNSRFDYVISKSLSFYLVENNKYETLINKKPNNIFNIDPDLQLPPEYIQNKLQDIIENDFDSDIDIIIMKYFSDYLNKDVKVVDTYMMKY
jgi:serine/threonine protein kinase